MLRDWIFISENIWRSNYLVLVEPKISFRLKTSPQFWTLALLIKYYMDLEFAKSLDLDLLVNINASKYSRNSRADLVSAVYQVSNLFSHFQINVHIAYLLKCIFVVGFFFLFFVKPSKSFWANVLIFVSNSA